jgi:hypothetical protein
VQQLKSAVGDRSQHFANLNHYREQGLPADTSLGNWWEIDAAIYEEFLELLPPEYCWGGFRLIEKLTGSIAATYLKLGDRYWCGYTDRDQTQPSHLVNFLLETT